MKIAMVRPRATRSHYLGLIEVAAAHGHEIVPISYGVADGLRSGRLREAGAALVRSGRAWRDVVRLARDPAVGAVVVAAVPFSWVVPVVALLFRSRTVAVHSSWPDWNVSPVAAPRVGGRKLAYRAWRMALERWVDVVAGVTPAVTSSALALVEGSGLRTELVGHTSALLAAEVVRQDDEARRPTVICVGRLEREKGVDRFLAIAGSAELAEVDFVIAGDGPMRADVEKRADGSANLRYVGQLASQDLVELYAAADLIVVPCRRSERWEELFGIALLEAMHAGVVPIAVDHVGPRHLLAGDLAEQLLGEEDVVAEATAAIASFVAAPAPDRQRLRRAAVTAAARYRPDEVAAAWLRALPGLGPESRSA